VSIAYWTLGHGGTPLVLMPGIPFNHAQLQWELDGQAEFYERLAQGRTVISYDSRGTGLSDRNARDISMDAQLLDLEAVLQKTRIIDGPFDLWGFVTSGPLAITYSARHPERVNRLLLWCSFARSSDSMESAQFQGLMLLAEKDWTTFTETMASVVYGWEAGPAARKFAAFMRECATAEYMARALPLLGSMNVTDLLTQVRSPTLIIHRRGMQYPTLEGAKQLAARIPNARLVVVEGESVQFGRDLDVVLNPVEEFLSQGSDDLPEGAAIIMFTDIANSTALTEQLGDSAFRQRARDLDSAMRAAVRKHGGVPIEGKLLGDGVLALFRSGRDGIDAALACDDAAIEAGLPLHIGLHAGDVIREGNDVYGGAVNIAARIASLAGAGEVLVSDTLRGLARTSAGVTFTDRGKQELKGVAEAQQVWAVVRG
jgi:class 3 adenylate cyclase